MVTAKRALSVIAAVLLAPVTVLAVVASAVFVAVTAGPLYLVDLIRRRIWKKPPPPRIPLEQQIRELAAVGIEIDRNLLEEAMARREPGNGTGSIEAEPWLPLLQCAGSEVDHPDTGEPVTPSSAVYNFDYYWIEDQDSYPNLLRNLARVAQVELAGLSVKVQGDKDTGERTTVTFRSRGRRHKGVFDSTATPIDDRFFDLVADWMSGAGPIQLYLLPERADYCVVGLTAENAGRFTQLTGVPLKLWTERFMEPETGD